MSEPTDTTEPYSADDALPPVEPPSAGFILQLFVVPAIIVSIIVVVWLAINALAGGSDDPSHYLRSLTRSGPARWQEAHNLADALRNPRNEQLRHNAEFAAQLAGILGAEMTQGENEPESIKMRGFLCRALGEFEVADGLPVLVAAAQPSDNAGDTAVRLEAIKALAVWLGGADPEPRDQVIGGDLDINATLIAAAHDDETVIRGAAAFALGILGTDAALTQLEMLLVDADSQVRCDAANGLARHGRVEGMDVLAEMLDPDAVSRMVRDLDPPQRQMQQSLIHLNALKATEKLVAANPSVDTAPLIEAIDRLLAGDVLAQVRIRAQEVRNLLEQHATVAVPNECRATTPIENTRVTR